jgi:predicted negative regulator of RcsB-dependent stress response
MTAYLNEDEQVEALKKWWKENGTSIVLGVLLGFGAIFGWQGWHAYRASQGASASNLFLAMENLAAAGKTEAALETGKRLLGEHTGSAYASFAALKLAQMVYAKGDKDNAAENLQWVVSHAPDEVISELAQLRLAQVRADQQKWDAAGTALDAIQKDFMPGSVAELRGDIAQAKGDLDAARKAYELALATGGDVQESVRMKLRAIGTGDAEKSS